MNGLRRATGAAMIAGAAVCLIASLSLAQTTTPPTANAQPANAPPGTPTLDALDHATQTLYRGAQSNIVRVQVPVKIPADHPLMKWWSSLNPKLREQLEAGAKPGAMAPRMYVESASTQPAQAGLDGNRVALPELATVVNVECAGMVLNGNGDVLLPVFIDAGYVRTLQVTLNDRDVTSGTVTAADAKTGLTIVRMAKPAGLPARFASSKPAPGSLMLMISPTRRTSRLAIWTDGQDDNAILVNTAGEFAGIMRNGHTLYPSIFRPIVDQLLSGEQVRRAELGVRIREVALDDPQRLKYPMLGARSAARIDDVTPDSAAANGGLEPGDLILSFAHEPVGDIPTFAANIANRRGRTEMLILRDGQEKQIIVELQPN
jgi:S1-C subfamily serine protease